MQMTGDVTAAQPGLLGDTVARDYGRKLERFHAFAAPELRALIGGLALRPGMRVLDAGCGVGANLACLADVVAPGGLALGFDLATAHVRAAHHAAPQALALQADLQHVPLRPGVFDLIWCTSTINHLRDPVAGLGVLAPLLRRGGRLALGQAMFLPEMVFAWDERLERVVSEACRAYYRDKYGLDERATTGLRALVGLLRAAGLQQVQARTVLIERISPLASADEAYLCETVFQGYWGEHLRPYLDPPDWAALVELIDPAGPGFCLRRPDFHYLQSFTLVIGTSRA